MPVLDLYVGQDSVIYREINGEFVVHNFYENKGVKHYYNGFYSKNPEDAYKEFLRRVNKYKLK